MAEMMIIGSEIEAELWRKWW